MLEGEDATLRLDEALDDPRAARRVPYARPRVRERDDGVEEARRVEARVPAARGDEAREEVRRIADEGIAPRHGLGVLEGVPERVLDGLAGDPVVVVGGLQGVYGGAGPLAGIVDLLAARRFK